MSSFLQSVRLAYSNKETLVREAITTQLSESVKEIQLCSMDDNLSGDSINLNDASNTLCSIIEAMFLHGLKDSLAHKARRVIINDIDQRPEPSFWSALLIFSHRQIIDQITALPNITTEIGQCRAWIRFALNDSLLSSYLVTIRQNSSALKLFYKTHAYIRDAEVLDVAQKLIEGVETCTIFTLPYNSSLLNSWPLPTLILTGIWCPTLRSCPIVSGVDVAQSLDNSISSNTPTTCSLDSAMSITSHNSEMRKILAMNEDEALKIILSDTSAGQLTSYSQDTGTSISSTSLEKLKIKSSEDDLNTQVQENSTLGNSLNRKSGWSFDESQNQNFSPKKDDTVPSTPNTELNRSISMEGRSTEHSYHALIESYNLISGPYGKTPNLQDVWQRFEDKSANASSSIESCEADANLPEMHDPEDLLEFEFISASVLDKNEIRIFLSQLGLLMQEKGLDAQNYECFECKHPLSMNVSKSRVCAFSGNSFCDSCMSTDPVIIPSRVIHNWDFKQYYVSKKVAIFINEVKNHPLLDMKVLNPFIYGGVEEMSRLQTIRVQLNFLRDYLYTCRDRVIEQLQRLVWPKEYMYEHIHQYSISDLSQIPGGVLADHLQTIVKFGKDHVTSCWLCSQKGFVCEICNKPKVLYPFDVESTYRCKVCNAVYHSECLNASKPCPKCKRRQEREHISLLDATLE